MEKTTGGIVVTVDAINLPVVSDVLSICADIVLDERLDKDVREEYMERFNEVYGQA